MFTIVIFLFLRFVNNLGFRVIKFIATFQTYIFWCLSSSDIYLNTFTFWANCDKILGYLTIFIMRSLNEFIFFFFQNSIADFDIYYILIKKSVWEVISN